MHAHPVFTQHAPSSGVSPDPILFAGTCAVLSGGKMTRNMDESVVKKLDAVSFS
jgi:hypothetical protein